MGTLHALARQNAAVVIHRTGTLERLLERVQARARRVEAEAAEERARAAGLLAELMGLPDAGQRFEAVEREPRFWTLGMAEHLLGTAAIASSADPAGGLLLAELALALVRRLDPGHYAESLITEQEVVAWSLQGEAHRRLGDFVRAESAFRVAARRLAREPLEIPERATFSRYLARLRQDQGWVDEALGLLQHAAGLYDQGQEPAAAGEVLSERGWLCLDAGDAAAAQASLEEALMLLRPGERPEALPRAWLGLALAYADLHHLAEARHALASARAVYEKTPADVESLRYAILEARVAERIGDVEAAIDRLAAVLPDLLALGAFYDAAIAALELTQIYAAKDRVWEVVRLRAALALLREPEALPERARSVLFFALQLASRRDRDSTELLAEAGEFLERARERPWLRFEVARHPRMELFWDLLEPDQRRGLCEDAGLPAELAAIPAAELGATERDLLSWTYELRAEVRIVFDSPAAAEERRGPWKILNRGRAWSGEEVSARLALLPERFEVAYGKLFWSDEARTAVLAMLLENVGVDEAVRLAPREIWLAALSPTTAGASRAPERPGRVGS